MRTKIIGIIAIVTFAFVAGYNVYTSQYGVNLSALAFANVEALAIYEYPDFEIACNQHKYTPPGSCWVGRGDCFYYGVRWEDCEFTGFTYHNCVTPCP